MYRSRQVHTCVQQQLVKTEVLDLKESREGVGEFGGREGTDVVTKL